MDLTQHEQPWFAVRCLFYDKKNKLYEERTVLVRATSYDMAISAAEKDAEQYAKTLDVEYLNYADVFHLFDKNITDGTEIFSLMRSVKMDKEEYIDHFLDTGNENRKE